MQTSIATVCLSGTLVDKLHAIADAGFDAVEVFEPDLIAAPQTPEEVRALCDRLGLRIALYQPFRDAEGVTEPEFAQVLRRAEAKFELMDRLGVDTVLVCSNVATASIDDDAVSAAQLARLADLAAARGKRLAFEALAWGRFIDDYRRAWRIVERADHPALGVCLDSFHILSRGHDPADIERIPGEKIFFVQLADAPLLSMDVLSWSRHHRLFPGEGGFDLPAFVGHTLRAGYTGPLSLEVFNDVFRQTDPARTARHALRSLTVLEDALGTDARPVPAPHELDQVEIKAQDTDAVAAVLERIGFAPSGRHVTKPAWLYAAGDARIVLNEHNATGTAPHVAGFGIRVDRPEDAAARAERLGAQRAHRRLLAGETDLPAVLAPDGTEILISGPQSGAAWPGEFAGGHGTPDPSIRGIDHVNLTEPAADIEEAVLFYGTALGLTRESSAELAGPAGLVRSQVLRSGDGGVRLALNVVPPLAERTSTTQRHAQHVAIACDDLPGLIGRARARGLRTVPVSANYYDDLGARFDLPPGELERLREAGLLYDRDAAGEYLHCYTETIGTVFFELVERRDRYDGFGAANTPVRLTAQHLSH
ncbi:bifunctional sugar phosphate isomerase/epimerase/4-hydroxyphenylpyruvate dioxygenase family protein [Leifsonia shinshuensis]|uniref:3-dehydroshikimate dehydratase n=1 Tax=Leifsonia shinshuensis TaxID=150026 RepID=A0A853CRL7_9MICO|nr:sugar phosphate isomerase/epimerase and 4-hydroxyphenylpyruvate domain-containing protein [Leifsonia shinshuensis]NYJ23052.1 4-hydroxyphenylpyruvate dioxygenase [Leifsonia shinshuensis]